MVKEKQGRWRKSAAVIALSMAMAFTMLPANMLTVLAEEEQTEEGQAEEIIKISSINTSLGFGDRDGTNIYAGETLEGNAWIGEDEDAHWYISEMSWSALPEDGKAVSGEAYRLNIVFTPEAGYEFDETTSIILNGVETEVSLNTDGTISVSYTYPETVDKSLISSLALAVDAPLFEGNMLLKDCWADTEEAEYENTWVPHLSWSPQPEDNLIDAGVAYTANVTVEPREGYQFDETTKASINGEEAKVSLNADGTVTVSYTFPEATAQPTSSFYVEASGDIIDKEYDGQPLENPTVYCYNKTTGEKKLLSGNDYTISWVRYSDTEGDCVIDRSQTKEAGIYYYSLKGKGDYKDKIESYVSGLYRVNRSYYTGLKKDSDGSWYYVKNDVRDSSFTGLAQVNGTGAWYYVEKGVLKWSYTGLVNYNGGWYYIQGGKLNESYSNLVSYNGGWYYVKNGKIDWSYSTLAQVNGKGSWYYVKNGKIDWSYSGLAQVGGKGAWYYVKKGVLDWNYTGLAQVNGKGSWFRVEKGVLNWNYSGLVNFNGGWYYIQSGVLNWNYTNLVSYNGSWYYVRNGVIDWKCTTLAQVNGKGAWYYVKNGKLDWTYTGLAQVNGKGNWYRVEKGVINWNYSGLVNYGGGWYYIQKGVLNWNYTNLVSYNGGWYYVKNGTIDWNCSTLAQVDGKGNWYRVEKGAINWNYSGLVNFNGNWYYIQKGVLNRGYTNLVSYNGGWYFVRNGKVDWSYSGLAQLKETGSWYYVKNGKIDWSYTGSAQVDGKGTYYYVKNGQLSQNSSGSSSSSTSAGSGSSSSSASKGNGSASTSGSSTSKGNSSASASGSTASSTDGNRTVYITDTGSKYHRAGCRTLSSSKETTLANAKALGLEPCKICNP